MQAIQGGVAAAQEIGSIEEVAPDKVAPKIDAVAGAVPSSVVEKVETLVEAVVEQAPAEVAPVIDALEPSTDPDDGPVAGAIAAVDAFVETGGPGDVPEVDEGVLRDEVVASPPVRVIPHFDEAFTVPSLGPVAGVAEPPAPSSEPSSTTEPTGTAPVREPAPPPAPVEPEPASPFPPVQEPGPGVPDPVSEPLGPSVAEEPVTIAAVSDPDVKDERGPGTRVPVHTSPGPLQSAGGKLKSPAASIPLLLSLSALMWRPVRSRPAIRPGDVFDAVPVPPG